VQELCLSVTECTQAVYGVRQTEIQTTQPLVPGPSNFESRAAFDKLKRHRSPGILFWYIQLCYMILNRKEVLQTHQCINVACFGSTNHHGAFMYNILIFVKECLIIVRWTETCSTDDKY